MSGKILIVDDIATNRIVLRVKLSSAFYDVRQAASVAAALAAIRADRPDLVIVSTRLPGDRGDMAEGAGALHLTALIRARGDDLPLLALGPPLPDALRARFLAADVDDVLEKPIDDHLLQARLRSLTRARDALQDLHLPDAARPVAGFAETALPPDLPARVILAAPTRATILPWRPLLEQRMPHRLTFHDHATLLPACGAGDVAEAIVLVIPVTAPQAGLRLLSELHAHPRARRMAMLVVFAGPAPAPLICHALDLGAQAVMGDGVDFAEIGLRLRTLLRRKRLADLRHASVQTGLRAAMTDPLTGLYNRRYALPQLERLLAQARAEARPLAVMVADLDHFKRINDSHGHAAGDAVLTEVGARLRDGLRSGDLLARIGGEEFLIALPDCPRPMARDRARALCARIGATPFALPDREAPVHVTISIGVAMQGWRSGRRASPGTESDADDWTGAVAALLLDADRALYGAKAEGRNTVTIGRPAA